MRSPLLEVNHLTLTVRDREIVRNISFQIFPGEIVAITGKSGSGKTSIALAILDMLPKDVTRTSGDIIWQSGSITQKSLSGGSKEWHALRGLQIGYTQQDVFGTFDPVMKIGAQMISVIQDRKGGTSASIRQELIEWMEEMGLHDMDRLMNSYPHQLSGGQLQRCQIAMVMSLQPLLLITDEPTSAIDKIHQHEILDIFRRLRDRHGMSVLCITHELSVSRQLADREISLTEQTDTTSSRELSTYPLSDDLTNKVLQAKQLMYQHRYGGLIEKKGAVIGPLDFDVIPGMRLGIIGESGSGKSTLGQLLTGLIKPSSGELIHTGRPVHFDEEDHIRLLRSRVQLVLQDGKGSLHPSMTIRQILRRSAITNSPASISSVIHEVGLGDEILDQFPHTLSGGEALRVSIARALLNNPFVLIGDESTSALDVPTRDVVMEMLLRLVADRHMALVLITHDSDLVRLYTSHLLVLHEGKIVESGKTREILHFPTHPVTQKIFGVHAT